MSKMNANLSLDLDNLWSYMKTHGDEGWSSYPTYLDLVVPRSLEVLKSLDLTITYMIVGVDAAAKENADAMRMIVDAGHEVGNHSFHHEPWLHLYPDEKLIAELKNTEDAIENATGKRPTGFRGPGYSCSVRLLEILRERGYRYDGSTLPTWLGPLARMYYFWTAKLTPEEKARRKKLFGSWRDVARPIRPYWWKMESDARQGKSDANPGVLEIPVSTCPLFRVPFHLSYVLYLSRFSPLAARLYFRNVLRLCRLLRVEPSILLHPLDFVGGDEVEQLAFFPAMEMPGDVKRERVRGYLADFAKRFNVQPMGVYVDDLLADGKRSSRLKTRRMDMPLGTGDGEDLSVEFENEAKSSGAKTQVDTSDHDAGSAAA